MSEVFAKRDVIRAETLYADQDISVALIALSGINRSTVNHGSATAYEVISGQGVMFVDYTMHPLEPGARVVVPKGTPYYDAGEDVVMWAVSSPPFNIDSVLEIK